MSPSALRRHARIRARQRRSAGAFALATLIALGADAVARADDAVRLRPVSIVDRQGFGFEAFRMLAPADWQVESAIVWWVPVNCAYPASLRLRAFNPRGAEDLNVFPGRPLAWSPRGIAFFPPGSYYLGNEVRPPVDAAQYIRQYVIPRYRRELAKARFTGSKPVPELAQAAAAFFQGLSPRVSAARVSFEYEQQGRAMQEDVYTALAALSLTPPIVNWGQHSAFSFKAEKGRLAAEAVTARA